VNTTRRFPVLDVRGRTHRTVPWSIAERAYAAYSRRFDGQSLEQLAERGGFGESELDEWAPGWRAETVADINAAVSPAFRLRGQPNGEDV